MERSDFDPRLSPLLGELIERRRKLVDVMAHEGSELDAEAAGPMLVQLAVLQGCIVSVSEVVGEAKLRQVRRQLP